MFTADQFDAFLSRVPEDVLVVLDEAYCDYVGHPNYSRAIDRVRSGANLLVLRTFSKAHGLAGLRIGYGIGPAAMLVEMNKVRTPFNTTSIAQAAALAAIGDVEHVRRSVELNRAGMAQLSQGLERLGVRFVPSFGNFLYFEAKQPGRAISDALLEHGVIVRPLDWMGMPQGVRVTVGTAEENAMFLAALKESCLSEPAGRNCIAQFPMKIPSARFSPRQKRSPSLAFPRSASGRAMEFHSTCRPPAIASFPSIRTRPKFSAKEPIPPWNPFRWARK